MVASVVASAPIGITTTTMPMAITITVTVPVLVGWQKEVVIMTIVGKGGGEATVR
jgi:hypothetical protein